MAPSRAVRFTALLYMSMQTKRVAESQSHISSSESDILKKMGEIYYTQLAPRIDALQVEAVPHPAAEKHIEPVDPLIGLAPLALTTNSGSTAIQADVSANITSISGAARGTSDSDEEYVPWIPRMVKEGAFDALNQSLVECEQVRSKLTIPEGADSHLKQAIGRYAEAHARFFHALGVKARESDRGTKVGGTWMVPYEASLEQAFEEAKTDHKQALKHNRASNQPHVEEMVLCMKRPDWTQFAPTRFYRHLITTSGTHQQKFGQEALGQPAVCPGPNVWQEKSDCTVREEKYATQIAHLTREGAPAEDLAEANRLKKEQYDKEVAHLGREGATLDEQDMLAQRDISKQQRKQLSFEADRMFDAMQERKEDYYRKDPEMLQHLRENRNIDRERFYLLYEDYFAAKTELAGLIAIPPEGHQNNYLRKPNPNPSADPTVDDDIRVADNVRVALDGYINIARELQSKESHINLSPRAANRILSGLVSEDVINDTLDKFEQRAFTNFNPPKGMSTTMRDQKLQDLKEFRALLVENLAQYSEMVAPAWIYFADSVSEANTRILKEVQYGFGKEEANTRLQHGKVVRRQSRKEKAENAFEEPEVELDAEEQGEEGQVRKSRPQYEETLPVAQWPEPQRTVAKLMAKKLALYYLTDTVDLFAPFKNPGNYMDALHPKVADALVHAPDYEDPDKPRKSPESGQPSDSEESAKPRENVQALALSPLVLHHKLNPIAVRGMVNDRTGNQAAYAEGLAKAINALQDSLQKTGISPEELESMQRQILPQIELDMQRASLQSVRPSPYTKKEEVQEFDGRKRIHRNSERKHYTKEFSQIRAFVDGVDGIRGNIL